MKKAENDFQIFQSLSDLHRVLGLPKPMHPMISFTNLNEVNISPEDLGNAYLLNFFKISYKSELSGQAKYGQHYYDFGEGGLVYTAPKQLFELDHQPGAGHLLLFHPDLLLGYPLAKNIKKYGFFEYAANEALHISDKEKETIFSIFKIIDEELQMRIDGFSQDVIISQIELLLNYSNRFYKRQFITRKAVNNDLLQKIDLILDNSFQKEKSFVKGIPTVKFLADELLISPSYLSDLLRSLIGLSTQQYIHAKLIEKAKEKLSTTNLTVSEIAYELGFEHSQSFSKLFKSKTNLSPLEFRRSFN